MDKKDDDSEERKTCGSINEVEAEGEEDVEEDQAIIEEDDEDLVETIEEVDE